MPLPTLTGLLRIGPRGWIDAARALRALLGARRRHAAHGFAANDLDRPSPGARAAALGDDQRALVERVRTMVPRVAHYLGWPSDCLIQALAAQDWLQRAGISSRIVVGGRARAGHGFDAHAWLLVGTREVTGWDNAEAGSYARFPARAEAPASQAAAEATAEASASPPRRDI